jgi:uncharacterized protein
MTGTDQRVGASMRPMAHDIADRLTRLPWDVIGDRLDRAGFAVTPSPILTASECASLARTFDDDALFRSTIDMARHRFGEGCYRYYRYPLPAVVAELRASVYPHVAALANRWAEREGAPLFPSAHRALLHLCEQHGQTRPTPLILRYHEGDWNALHQDVYGDVVFPLQIAVALTRPGIDYEGGEMLFVEQRPRAQSRGHAVLPERGHGVIFTTRARPVTGTRGSYRVQMRHGTSTLTRGTRLTLGVIFHDAK